VVVPLRERSDTRLLQRRFFSQDSAAAGYAAGPLKRCTAAENTKIPDERCKVSAVGDARELRLLRSADSCLMTTS